MSEPPSRTGETLPRRVLQQFAESVAVARAGVVGASARLSAELALPALMAVIAAALAGFYFPLLDGINQFTPLWTAAALGTLAISWLGGIRETVRRASALALFAVFLFLAPLLRFNFGSETARHAQPDERPVERQVERPVIAKQAIARQVKVMTFNVVWGRDSSAGLEAFIRAEEPDIILLQELDRRRAEVLDQALRTRYPHRRYCVELDGCDGALLSKWPVLESRHILRSEKSPASISATVEIDGRAVRVVGVHMTNPRAPRQQQREIAWLTSHLEEASRRATIVAGDFNLTPWTFTLARFAGRTGLVRHTGIGGTWPANGRFFALFPIDHVLSSKHFSLTRIAAGPRLGSDHLPVVATLALR